MKPGTNKFSEGEIIGDRKNYEVTLFPSTVKAGELLTVRLPQLHKDVCFVPNSVTCVNNLAKALVKGFSVKYGNKNLYKNTDERTFSLFRDLWQSNNERQRQRANGIAESMRKKISGDETYQTSPTNEGLFKSSATLSGSNSDKFLKTAACLGHVPCERSLNLKYASPPTTKF